VASEALQKVSDRCPIGYPEVALSEEVKKLGGRSFTASSSQADDLLVVGSVRRIIGGLYFREPFQAGGVDLCDPVLEGGAFDLISLAIPENAFQGDELPLLESLGELREIPPGEDAVPLGARFVVAFVVLPALLGCDVEDNVLFVVLSGFGFCVLSEAADEDDFVEHGV
jgi:hypothetical protein